MKLDIKLFDDLHRILDDLGICLDMEDRMLLRTRVKEGFKELQQRVTEVESINEKLDGEYAAMLLIMRMVHSGSGPIPCTCGCEGCLNDRKTVREALGDWQKVLETIDQGNTDPIHTMAAQLIDENEKLKERNAILEHYAVTTDGLWATDREDMVIGDCFDKLKHPLPPEMREEKSDVQSS